MLLLIWCFCFSDCHIMKKLKPLPHPKKMASKSLLFDLDPCGNDVDTAVHVNKCLKEVCIPTAI